MTEGLKTKNMSNGKAFAVVFVRAKLSVTQVLTFWLMITLKWNTQVVLLVLTSLTFPSKGE